MPLLYVLEQRLSPTEDEGVHDQPELVDQALVHQAANQRGAADGMHVFAGLLFHPPDLFDVANDPRVLPGDLVQSPGQDNMGRPFRKVAPQLTVVTDTTAQSGVAAHASGARAAWVVSIVVVAHETTAVPGLSSNGR